MPLSKPHWFKVLAGLGKKTKLKETRFISVQIVAKQFWELSCDLQRSPRILAVLRSSKHVDERQAL